MLCPHCLHEVKEFRTERVEGEGRSYTCPQCQALVPVLYVRDYHDHPPLVLNLLGARGHGKTVYLSSLLHVLERTSRDHPGFYVTALDEASLRDWRARTRQLEQEQLPPSTPVHFHEPVVLQLSQAGDLDPCHLLLYDGGGEALHQVRALKANRDYLCRSPAAVWLVGLEQGPGGPRVATELPLQDLLTHYLQALAELDADPRGQFLLVVLTKGDRLRDQPGVPRVVSDYLTTPDAVVAQAMSQHLLPVSDALRSWLEGPAGQHHFVRLAERKFHKVVYCVVSALGAEPVHGRLPVRVNPRGVLAPLYWLQAQLLKDIRVETGGKSQAHASLREAVEQAPAGAVVHLPAREIVLEQGLRITRPLSLVGAGAGPEGTRLVCEKGEPVLRLAAEAVLKVRDLTLEHRGTADAHVLWVSAGQVELERCRLRGAVRQREGGQGGCGLLFSGQAAGLARACHFEANAVCGIAVLEKARPRLLDNTCVGGRHGLLYRDRAGGLAQGNRCRDWSESGICVADQAAPTLRANTCAAGSGPGLAVALGAAPHYLFRGNTLAGVQDSRPHIWLCQRLGLGPAAPAGPENDRKGRAS